MSAGAAHAERVAALARALRARSGPVGLGKSTSNLFRERPRAARQRLPVAGLDRVLAIDPARGCVEAEGMATYETLTAACLAQGVMPAVVPQLKTITLGGAVAGVGIEATSFRHGLVHETVSELEVLTADGRVRVCTPDNEFADLFFGFPNSYGTLGYALRVVAATIPVKPFVHVEHRPFGSARELFAAMAGTCAAGEADFVDAVAFAPDRLYLTTARFVEAAPHASDYTFERIYYRSIPERREDWLTAEGYIWRWDTDWFWCSRNLGAQHPLLRRLYGRARLNSRTYTRLMRWNSRWGLTRALDRLRGRHRESVIQDVDIPLERAAGFLDFLAREIGLWPVWLCPIRAPREARRFPLYPMRAGLHVNFGFWDVVRTREPHPPGHFNRLVEREAAACGGIKSLYSESFYTPEEFDAAYGGAAYRHLKAKYDPHGAFPTLYEKCVLRR